MTLVCRPSTYLAVEPPREAGVGRLYLVHYAQSSVGEILAEARAIFPDTFLAEEGDTIQV